LIDFGGTILTTLFDTATLSDLHSLHESFDEQKSRDTYKAHFLLSQITYFKNLDYCKNKCSQNCKFVKYC